MNRQPDDPGPGDCGQPSEDATNVFPDDEIRRLLIGTFIILLTTLLIFAATAETPRSETTDGARIIIIDGDTVALPCRQADCTGPERIRIFNIDAPESFRATCEAEMIAGLAAKARLAALLRSGAVHIQRCEPDTGRCTDRYGRTLARLSTAAGDVGQIMITEGHALPWQPGAAAKQQRINHWCGR